MNDVGRNTILFDIWIYNIQIVFDQGNEQLDHLFVSSAIAAKGVEVEHVHVNNWAETIDLRASDHDPSVVKFNIC